MPTRSIGIRRVSGRPCTSSMIGVTVAGAGFAFMAKSYHIGTD
jgi:hypothetical protein